MRHKKKIIFVIMCYVIFFNSFSIDLQNQIAGTISNASDKPLTFVNVLLLKGTDSQLVRGLTTSEQGIYRFDQPFLISFSSNMFIKLYYLIRV